MGEPSVPDWASLLGDDYAHFREVLVGVLAEMKLAVDPDHIDCGVLHAPDGTTMGLTNLVRLCHPSPRERWPAIIAEHLRRSSAKAVPIAFEIAESRLRLRLVPERHIAAKPELYVGRELARELHVALALDNPEHVVFVNPRDADHWGRSVAELFAIAERTTRAEPALEVHPVTVPEGSTITALVGDSYFAASHVLFLDRYLAPSEDGYVVAVPDRHAVIALSIGDPRWLAGLGPMVRLAHTRFTEAPGAITDQLYWRRPDGGLVKIACGVRDDGAPWVAPPEEFNAMVGRLSANPHDR